MDAVSVFVVILLLLIVGLFALGIWMTVIAKRTHEAITTMSPARTRQTIEKSFTSMLWANADGPGDINRRRRQFRGNGAIVSVAIEALPDGKTHVSSWVSDADTQFGIVSSRGVSKPRRVVKLIESTQV